MKFVYTDTIDKWDQFNTLARIEKDKSAVGIAYRTSNIIYRTTNAVQITKCADLMFDFTPEFSIKISDVMYHSSVFNRKHPLNMVGASFIPIQVYNWDDDTPIRCTAVDLVAPLRRRLEHVHPAELYIPCSNM